jgi:hypothetical protein
MIINGMLYLKLRRIEILADGLKNDPLIISKYYKYKFKILLKQIIFKTDFYFIEF